MKILILSLLLSTFAVAQSLSTSPFPDAPSTVDAPVKLGPQPVFIVKGSVTRTGFFTFRKSWSEPTLKPDKKSWALFIGAQAAMWTSLAIANRNKEAWHSEAPALAGVTALDFAMFKLISPSFSVEAPVYAAIHYIRQR